MHLAAQQRAVLLHLSRYNRGIGRIGTLGVVKGIVPRIFEMQRFVYLARGITVEPLTRNILGSCI